MTARNLANSSAATQRSARHELHLEHEVLEAVFAARTGKELQRKLVTQVYAADPYARLPVYRQVAIQAYLRGCLDTLARQADEKAPQCGILEVPIAVKRPSARRGRASSIPPADMRLTGT